MDTPTAAGSLFTSCVTNTEPQGIKDIRQAKADYLESLAKVKDATAELVKAKAATEQAVAAYNQAIATLKQIEATVEQAKADTAIAGMKAAAEIAAVKAQQALAEAQQALEIALKKIEAEALSLTADEQKAITEAVLKYNFAQKLYNKAYADYVKADSALFMEKLTPTKGQSIEDYEALIAEQEENITLQYAKIATAEGLKEEPQAVKDSIEKWEDVIKTLEIEKVKAQNAKLLYEADSLKEASKAYEAEYKAYTTDEPKKAEFAFVDKDKKAIEYPLTNGKSLDAQFAEFVNNTVALAFVEGGSNTKTAKNYGISVDEDKKNILVGKIGTKPATKDQLDSAIVTVGAIVSALNREQVVLDNIADSTTIAEAEAKAAKLDSIYKADRAILAAGLDKYSVYALAKDTAKMFEDTVKTAFSADSTAKAKLVADTAAIIKATGDAAAAYIAANQQFVKVANYIRESGREADPTKWGKIHSKDSAEFIAAVKALGSAQAAYFGKQDSLPLAKIVMNESNTSYRIDTVKVAFSDLTAEGFVERTSESYGTKEDPAKTSLYGGIGYGAFANNTFVDEKTKKSAYYYRFKKEEVKAGHAEPKKENWYAADAFTRVINVALGNDVTNEKDKFFDQGNNTYKWDGDLKDTNIAYYVEGYDSKQSFAYHLESLTSTKDTINSWCRVYAKGIVEEFETLATDVKAQQATDAAYTVAKQTYEVKVAAVETAKEKYFTVHKNFWGLNSIPKTNKDTAAVVAPQKFEWNEKTFTEPFTCVRFDYNPENPEWNRSIRPSTTLNVILDGIYGGTEFTQNPTKADRGCRIFWGDKRTEYALALCYAQVAEDLGSYESRTAQLENINKQYEAIVADVAAKVEEVEEANEAYYAFNEKLTGEKEGKRVSKLEANKNVKDGEWDLGGKQLEWAEKYAANYPAVVKAASDGVKSINNQIKDIKDFISTLEYCYVTYSNVVNDEHDWSIDGKWGGILTRLDNDIKIAKESIKTSNGLIAGYEKSIQQIEAGFDPESTELQRLQTELELAAQKLEEASQILAIAQAEYEAVIKKYGINE